MAASLVTYLHFDKSALHLNFETMAVQWRFRADFIMNIPSKYVIFPHQQPIVGQDTFDDSDDNTTTTKDTASKPEPKKKKRNRKRNRKKKPNDSSEQNSAQSSPPKKETKKKQPKKPKKESSEQVPRMTIHRVILRMDPIKSQKQREML